MNTDQNLQERMDQVAAQAAEQQPEQAPEEYVNQEQEQAEQPVEEHNDTQADDRERNFAKLREERERAERERDEYRRKVQELEQRYSQQYTAGEQSQRPRYDKYTQQDAQYHQQLQQEYDKLKDDDLVEGRHFSRVQQELAELKRKQAEQERITYTQRAMGSLRSRYPDFDQVVSDKNVSILKEKYPSIAQSLASGNDLQSIGEAAYEVIKRFGIHETDKYAQQKAHVSQNSAKPRPMGSTSPLAQANQYDTKRYTQDDLKRAYDEMVSAMRNG